MKCLPTLGPAQPLTVIPHRHVLTHPSHSLSLSFLILKYWLTLHTASHGHALSSSTDSPFTQPSSSSSTDSPFTQPLTVMPYPQVLTHPSHSLSLSCLILKYWLTLHTASHGHASSSSTDSPFTQPLTVMPHPHILTHPSHSLSLSCLILTYWLTLHTASHGHASSSPTDSPFTQPLTVIPHPQVLTHPSHSLLLSCLILKYWLTLHTASRHDSERLCEGWVSTWGWGMTVRGCVKGESVLEDEAWQCLPHPHILTAFNTGRGYDNHCVHILYTTWHYWGHTNR